jgi:hypothetical protein
MSLTISQMSAVSYPAVVAEKRKAANQWEESALLRELERQGGVHRRDLGPTIEAPLDYQRNQGGEFLVTELTPTSLQATEVVTSASYTPAELSIPVTWSKRTEALNPSKNQKIAVVSQLIENGLNTHDDLIELGLFATTATNGFQSLVAYFPTSGQGSVGGIDSAVNTWWRHQSNTYVDDSDIESGMTVSWNQATKGSGSKMSPTLAVSDAPTQALFEGTQQANQRYVDTDELKAGFKILGFKTCRYVFSQYGTTTIFMFSPKTVFLEVSKEYFRMKGETQELQNGNGFNFKIYSALQLVTTNKSRVGIVHL